MSCVTINATCSPYTAINVQHYIACADVSAIVYAMSTVAGHYLYALFTAISYIPLIVT